MVLFFRSFPSLSPVIIFIVFLLPLCQSENVVALRALHTTMAGEFTCPSGGKWYACPSNTGSSKFVGCCAGDADPCTTGCTQGNIRPVAYPFENYGIFPDASCGINSDFFTCAAAVNKTFWGCCKSNPCSSDPPTCPDGNLTPAFVDQPAQINFYVASQIASGTSSISSASVSAISSSDGGSKSNGAVIGGAVGGAAGAILIISLIVLLLWRRRRNAKTVHSDNVEVASPTTNNLKAFDPHSPNPPAQSPAPPTYSATSGDYYQSITPQDKANRDTQSPYSQGQWAYTTDRPQEMEADVGPPNRYSELPAEVARPGTHNRYSELSTGPSCRVSPYHSPKASQNENTVEPKARGLGVVTEDSTKPLGLPID
ncbi:uncharacterized protein M421DRAFT_415046 [Didymella exigua CBS 183.55]|uniref:Uncharacterized protein n=1 Tax=Didymella exigua CBS 183.55 TaxID=1150837 RepID=A0A6A5S258_9PLEO|nr:uncharacterized protein M421DRAFT_415046 [Didymella exigua CBS 183.55]KAF1933993.1 hypothetical protein M421DRAFT_415046 [Didymella exigua CBS 183.55]